MKKTPYAILAILILILIPLSFAQDAQIENGKSLVTNKVPCSQLNESQLEDIGDYFMEQMHPGDQHTAMENMIGGEGSESLRLAHINMAKAIYCGNSSAMMGKGMMGNFNMMQGGMMGANGFYRLNQDGNMMGSYSNFGVNSIISWIWLAISIAILIIAILVIVLLFQKITSKKRKN